MSRINRSITGAAGLLAVIAIVAVGAGAVGAKSAGKATSGTVYAAITHSDSARKIEFVAGNVTDKVLGNGAVTFELTVGAGTKTGSLAAKGTVVVFTKTGELSGTDSVDINTSAGGAVTFTNGKLKLTKGTGGQKGHSFVGTVTGSAPSILGPYVFHDKGTYK